MSVLMRLAAIGVCKRRFAQIARCLAALSVMPSLAACAGVGVVNSPDPLVKLNDAAYLFQKENRPVPAETLIQEAIVIYEKRDDSHGLGNANREYGDFLRSGAVFNWRDAYRRHGFLDRSVTYDNRLEKASEHYSKALEYYRLAKTQEMAAGKYDALTNVYYNMALSHFALGARNEACADYDRALHAYNDNMQRNPTAHPHGSQAGTVPESIAAAKKEAVCREEAT
jgi:tetratricopeptide (TPR) repeat protein